MKYEHGSRAKIFLGFGLTATNNEPLFGVGGGVVFIKNFHMSSSTGS
jgi:hypothetical protein